MSTDVYDREATVTIKGETVAFPTWWAAHDFAKGYPFGEFGPAVIQRADGERCCGNAPEHDWAVCGASVLKDGYQIRGWNLNAAPAGYGHDFHWRFTPAGEVKLDCRYDFSGADLDPAFLAYLERSNARTELR